VRVCRLTRLVWLVWRALVGWTLSVCLVGELRGYGKGDGVAGIGWRAVVSVEVEGRIVVVVGGELLALGQRRLHNSRPASRTGEM
jgi:hypothetical protein